MTIWAKKSFSNFLVAKAISETKGTYAFNAAFNVGLGRITASIFTGSGM
jgi:hypothetical protein